MVLHALRGQVGTDNFWKGIQLYYARHRNAHATTDDLRRDMETASGQDLGWFFSQWLARVDSPVLDGGWSWDAARKADRRRPRADAGRRAYRLPLEVGVTPDSGRDAHREDRAEPGDAAVRDRGRRAAEDVTLDPNAWMLMDAKFVDRARGIR